MSEELKPCPFCGGSAFEMVDEDKGDDYGFVACSGCHVETPYGYKEYRREKWNRRAEPEELPEWLIDELINGLVLAKDDKTEGWNDALEWVLSLKKEASD